MNKIIVLTFLLVGCGGEVVTNTTPVVDVCLQKIYFDDCMKLLPAGPTTTNYNDWSEVISECTNSARLLSFRQSKDVKESCKTGYTY